MSASVNHQELHRTAKYFMDNGRAATHEQAMGLLKTFGLSVHVGEEVAESSPHQVALLTLVNVARRTLLGGVDVVDLADARCCTPLGASTSLRRSVEMLGGCLVDRPRHELPSAVIGGAHPDQNNQPCWNLTWEGWRGGVVAGLDDPLSDDDRVPLAPATAAAVCTAEAFAYFEGGNPMACRRSLGLSLWQPGRNWLDRAEDGPELSFLPSRLWLVGLGNLGQAYAWLLASLPYKDRAEVELFLQDFDRLAMSNDSTSVLSSEPDIGRMKTRVVSEWLEARGFHTRMIERRFSAASTRSEEEPGAALWGVDNANARMSLDKAGFDLVVEAGLGAGPQAFRSISLHTFPATRSAAAIWSQVGSKKNESVRSMPAYRALERDGMDECGLTQLASRTVGVPFVGVIAGSLVVSEILRRLHRADATEVMSTSVASLSDVELIHSFPAMFTSGYVDAERRCSTC